MLHLSNALNQNQNLDVHVTLDDATEAVKSLFARNVFCSDYSVVEFASDVKFDGSRARPVHFDGGNKLVSGGRRTQIWDSETARPTKALSGHSGSVTAVHIITGHNIVFTGSCT